MTKAQFRAVLILILLASGVVTDRLARPADEQAVILQTPSSAVPDGFVLVKEVVDGDTIALENGTRVRYIGVDTPETIHPSKPVQCFGKEASAFNRSLVEGKAVRLVRDISETDKYGRLLRYIYLEDGTFVNLALVSAGYATVVTYPPDIEHATEFQAAAREARSEGRGLWSACPVKK